MCSVWSAVGDNPGGSGIAGDWIVAVHLGAISFGQTIFMKVEVSSYHNELTPKLAFSTSRELKQSERFITPELPNARKTTNPGSASKSRTAKALPPPGQKFKLTLCD